VPAEGRALEQKLALAPLERQVAQILAIELQQLERPDELCLARTAAQ
jgi:hypothetical protein